MILTSLLPLALPRSKRINWVVAAYGTFLAGESLTDADLWQRWQRYSCWIGAEASVSFCCCQSCSACRVFSETRGRASTANQRASAISPGSIVQARLGVAALK